MSEVLDETGIAARFFDVLKKKHGYIDSYAAAEAFLHHDALQSESSKLNQEGDWKLEKNECSRLHHFVDYLFQDDLRTAKWTGKSFSRCVTDYRADWSEVVPFVVQHDWASAFEGAEDVDLGDFKFPYPYSAFELRINGRLVIVIGHEKELDGRHFTCWFRSGEHWCGLLSTDPVSMFAIDQVRAICIALDASVATHTVVRAPSALNKKRREAGRMPLYDYHVVDLNRHRHRVWGQVEGTGSRKRLHFRRGHWRHYEQFKTWIKWTLVGDPDLGFVDKEYRL